MEFTSTIILEWMASYFWPYTRISTMFMVMTVTGANYVSRRIRLYLGLAVTFGVMPMIPVPPSDLANCYLFKGSSPPFEQIVIGVAMGYGDGQFMLPKRLSCTGTDTRYAIKFGFCLYG